MPAFNFSFRFIIDRHFFDDVMKKNSKSFLSLMYISTNSLEYKKKHNLMSEKIRADIIRLNSNYSPEYIKSSLNKINEPEEIEEIEDEVVRNIKYAIYYTQGSRERTTPICILTSDSMKKEYMESPHLENIKNVSIKSGEEALELIMEYKRLSWEK